MYLVYDSSTHNVLAEYETFQEADQRRIGIVGANPHLAEFIEVIDLDGAIKALYAKADAETARRAPA